MLWEIQRDIILSDDENINFEGTLERNLAKISTKDIENLSNRIYFYLNHFKIMSEQGSESKDSQIKKLEKINQALSDELSYRKKKIHI